MYRLLVFLPLLVAGFFGRFLGSEGAAIITGKTHILLCALLLLVICRHLCFHLKTKRGFGLVLVPIIDFSCIFLINCYCNFVLCKIGFYLDQISPVFLTIFFSPCLMMDPNQINLDLTLGLPGAAQEALPQAPAPAEVPHPAPDQEEQAALLGEIKTFIVQLIRDEVERGQGRLSFHFPEMQEIYSSAAESIISDDLEISRETPVENLREWAEAIRRDPSLLRPLMTDFLGKRR